MRLIYKVWQLIRRVVYLVELKRKYPDPLIVCANAGACCATDGYLCEPLNCEACTEPPGLYGDVSNAGIERPMKPQKEG